MQMRIKISMSRLSGVSLFETNINGVDFSNSSQRTKFSFFSPDCTVTTNYIMAYSG